ncbi:hypothetical protein pphageBV72_02 [Pseudomonas phage pphageBV72]|nr:hypothetical protein pphageT21_02 [Pseudomonas phage pphageT21]UAW53814.1 hypothetical protein pphageBV72_02 [Pseudomonas phage pphageBV72]
MDYTRAKAAYDQSVQNVTIPGDLYGCADKVVRIELFSEAVGSMDKWEPDAHRGTGQCTTPSGADSFVEPAFANAPAFDSAPSRENIMRKEFKLVPVEPTVDMRAEICSGINHDHMVRNYKLMLAAAPQPPALGGEPEVVGYGFRNTMVGRSPAMMELRPDIPANDQYGGQLWYALITQDDYRAHLAPLQAEIDSRTNAQNILIKRLKEVGQERDQLKARCDELEDLLKSLLRGRGNDESALRIGAALSKPAGSEKV